jgi:DNA-binding NarL/FixJ family response regulator
MNAPTRRIFLADDHFAVRRGLRALFEGKPKYEVVGEAVDGFEAINLASELVPDIAILDFSMPQMNGLEVAKFLKRHLPQVRIVMYTRHEEEAVLSRLVEAGVQAYVSKADPVQNLVAAVDALAVGRTYFACPHSKGLANHSFHGANPTSPDPLTGRERQIVQLIAGGRLNREIAETLHISVKTVETHRFSAAQKLNSQRTADLVRYAVRNNLIEP